MGELCNGQYEKLILKMKKKPEVNKKKNRNVYFCVVYSCYFSTNIHRVIDKLKKLFNISWIIVRMYYHIFNHLTDLLNGDFSTRVGQRFLYIHLMYIECNYFLPFKVNSKCVYKGKFQKNV